MKKRTRVVNARRLPFDLIEEFSDWKYKQEDIKIPNAIINNLSGLYKSKDRRTVRAIVWDSIVAICEVYPKIFEYFVNDKKNWQIKAWSSEGNSQLEPPRTILIRMNYKYFLQSSKLPDTIANCIKDEHTRLCAVLLHEIGEAILWSKYMRDKCDFGIPAVSEYAKKAKAEAFCEALAFVIITTSKTLSFSRSELDFIELNPKPALDNALVQMRLK